MVASNGLFEGKRVLSANAVRELQSDQVRGARVSPGEFVERVRGRTHNSIYGLGNWREELDAAGNATLISSPSWAGAYPWIDRTARVYGVMLAHVDVAKAHTTPSQSFGQSGSSVSRTFRTRWKPAAGK